MVICSLWLGDRITVEVDVYVLKVKDIRELTADTNLVQSRDLKYFV